MNLDELERLHRKAVGGDWRNLPSNMLNEIWDAFPALLALARDGERYRLEQKSEGIWFHVNAPSGLKASINLGHRPAGTIVQRVLEECVAIDAARKGEKP